MTTGRINQIAIHVHSWTHLLPSVQKPMPGDLPLSQEKDWPCPKWCVLLSQVWASELFTLFAQHVPITQASLSLLNRAPKQVSHALIGDRSLFPTRHTTVYRVPPQIDIYITLTCHLAAFVVKGSTRMNSQSWSLHAQSELLEFACALLSMSRDLSSQVLCRSCC